MNSEMGFSLRTPASDGACLRDDPRGARHWAHLRAAHSRRLIRRACHAAKTCADDDDAGPVLFVWRGQHAETLRVFPPT